MADKRFQRPSAFKHGGFSKTVLFPWEDADEFDALHRSLQDEWEPSGALEEDAVYTILTCIWRKRRIRDKRNLDTLAALQHTEFKALSEMPVPFFDTKQEVLAGLSRQTLKAYKEGLETRALSFRKKLGCARADETPAVQCPLPRKAVIQTTRLAHQRGCCIIVSGQVCQRPSNPLGCHGSQMNLRR